jgi:hypothetical protein
VSGARHWPVAMCPTSLLGPGPLIYNSARRAVERGSTQTRCYRTTALRPRCVTITGNLAGSFHMIQSRSSGTGLAMSIERDDRTLAAELLAVKTVMVHVLGRINRLDPMLADAIQSGFGDATAEISKMVTKSGKGASSERSAKALAVVETLRASMLETDRPHAGVGRQRR